MGKSISQLKELIKSAKKDNNGVNITPLINEELEFLKQHMSLNISDYLGFYNTFIKNVGIEETYDKLNKEQLDIIINHLEERFNINTNNFKLHNTVYKFKSPILRLWLQLDKKIKKLGESM